MWFTGKGLTPLSSLSCSRSAFLGGTPEVVGLRFLGVATGKLPTPARVKRTCRALHPIGLAALVRVPPGDLPCSLGTAHPLWTGPTDGIAATGVSRSPAFSAFHGIEFEDYSAGQAGLLSKASLELDEHVSVHPALRDADLTGGKTVPCAGW